MCSEESVTCLKISDISLQQTNRTTLGDRLVWAYRTSKYILPGDAYVGRNLVIEAQTLYFIWEVCHPRCLCETRRRYVVKHNLITEVYLMNMMENNYMFRPVLAIIRLSRELNG